MTIDEEIVAALDMVYAHSADAPHDVPVGNVRRGPWALRGYGIVAAAAAAVALIVAYPAITATSTRQAARGTVSAHLVTSLASLHPVVAGAAQTPHIRSVVLDHRRVTAWVARVGRSAKYVYDLDDARLTEFTASLPPSDSGLTDPCSWTVRLGGAAQTYQTQQTASVQMKLAGPGPMSITVAPTQPGGGLASCAMTNPVVQAAPLGTVVSSSSPGPVASQVLAPPPPVQPQPSGSPAQQQPAASPSASTVPSPASSPAPTPSATAAPTQTAVATATSAGTSTPAAPPTDPPVQPEGGN
jgi:hypothetical protein